VTFTVSIARQHGYCGGVTRALRLAQEALDAHRDNGVTVVSVGQLIHNESALASFARAGLKSIDRVEDAPAGAVVILRAHGTPQRKRDILAAKGCIAVDTTCPALTQAHKVVDASETGNTTVVLFGDADHEECIALKDGRPNILAGTNPEAMARAIAGATPPVAVVSQSSKPPVEFDEFVQALRNHSDMELEVHSTICAPVRSRQKELERLLHSGIDRMIVVGGKRSSNSHGLGRLAERRVPTLYLQRPEQIEAGWIHSGDHVGLIGGTSTPLSVLQDFRRYLEGLGGVIADDGGIHNGDSGEKPGLGTKK